MAFLTPYKRKHGVAVGGDAMSSPKMSPVPNAPETPIGHQLKEGGKMAAASSLRSAASHVSRTPASVKKFDQRSQISASSSLSKIGAFDEASVQSYSLDGTCQNSAIFMNHHAIAFRSLGTIDIRLFKEDSNSLQPKTHRVSCSGPIVDFFFMASPELRADECCIIVAGSDQLSCHSIRDSKGCSQVTPPHVVSEAHRPLRIISCDGVCVGDICYIAVSAVLPDASCVVQVIQLVHSRQEPWRLIQEIPIASSSAVLRWRKCSSDFNERKKLWFVCGDSDGFATLFECIFSNEYALTSITASDAYPVSSLPLTSVDVSDSLVAIVSSGSCALLTFDLDASTLRPLKGNAADLFLPVASGEKGAKVLAASVCPNSDCVAVMRCGGAASNVFLELHYGLTVGSLPLPSIRYGLQPHHRSFCGSAACMSWRCNADGNVIAACNVHLLSYCPFAHCSTSRLRPHTPNLVHRAGRQILTFQERRVKFDSQNFGEAKKVI